MSNSVRRVDPSSRRKSSRLAGGLCLQTLVEIFPPVILHPAQCHHVLFVLQSLLNIKADDPNEPKEPNTQALGICPYNATGRNQIRKHLPICPSSRRSEASKFASTCQFAHPASDPKHPNSQALAYLANEGALECQECSIWNVPVLPSHSSILVSPLECQECSTWNVRIVQFFTADSVIHFNRRSTASSSTTHSASFFTLSLTRDI